MPVLPLNSVPILTLAHLVTGQLHPASVPDDQWDLLVNLALGHGLGVMLLWSLRQAGWVRAGDPQFEPLVDFSRRSGRLSLQMEKARRQAAVAFDQASIPVIWLKGAGLAHTYYPEPHLRPMGDLDVLVPAQQLAAARQALLSLGFRPAEVDFFEMGGFTDEARHHECLAGRSGQVKLELHFRLLVPSMNNCLEEEDLDWFWSQTMDLAAGAPSFRVLKPEANILHLCAHTILQNQGLGQDLLHLLDLHQLVTQSTVEWDLVVEQAVALRWTGGVETALGLLPDLFGTQLPAGVLDALRKRRPVAEIPIANTHSIRRWEEWHKAFKRMTMGQRLRLVWLTIFPPQAYLRQQYQISPGRLLLPYYVYHFLDGGSEVIRAFRRRSSKPEGRIIGKSVSRLGMGKGNPHDGV